MCLQHLGFLVLPLDGGLFSPVTSVRPPKLSSGQRRLDIPLPSTAVTHEHHHALSMWYWGLNLRLCDAKKVFHLMSYIPSAKCPGDNVAGFRGTRKQCISYFSPAVIEHHAQRPLIQGKGYLGLCRGWEPSMVGGRSRRCRVEAAWHQSPLQGHAFSSKGAPPKLSQTTPPIGSISHSNHCTMELINYKIAYTTWLWKLKT